MNLKSIFATALVGAVVSVGTASASALDNLNLVLFNPSAPGNNSFVVDLDVSFNDIATGANTGFSTNVLETILSETTSTLSSLEGYQYSVFGLGDLFIPDFMFDTPSIITSSARNDFIIPTTTSLTAVFNNADLYLDLQDYQTFVSENEPGTPGFFEAASFSGGTFGNLVVPTNTDVGQFLDVLLPEFVDISSIGEINLELIDIGDFLLAADGTFTYSTDVVTVIPVPAAVWLFGSALVGGVARYGRRRNAQLA